MAGDSLRYRIDDEGVFRAPLELSYPYSRTVGPHIGRFLTGLREGRIEGVRLADGRVLVPPPEVDPFSGEASDQWVTVEPEGTIDAWTWVPEAHDAHPLSGPFAFALIRLDGTDSSLLHVIDAGSPDDLRVGARVRARWSDERVGAMTDIACFEVIA